MRDFWGTLYSSVKQIKDPYLFDWEQGIALHAMQGNWASSLSDREVSWSFSSCGGNLGYIVELQRWKTLTTFVFSAKSGPFSSSGGHPGVETRLGRTIRMLLQVRQETEVHFLVGTVILGFLSIFKNSQASSPYEAFNSVCLSRAHRDVRPPVQMTLTRTAFSRVYTGDSDMPSSCEMKDEPEYKPLQGIRAFF